MVELKPVEGSTAVAATGYDPASQTLAVRFKNGGLYHYKGVESDTAAELDRSPSMGTFIARNIRGQYDTEKIDEEDRGG